jgi:pyrroline-5-carboxylate reductase
LVIGHFADYSGSKLAQRGESTVDRIGFLGAGQMATALAKGFVTAKLLGADSIVAFDPVPAAGQAFQAAIPGVKLAATNAEVVSQSKIVFLAVKPQHVAEVMREVQGSSKDKLFVSIAAGVTISKLSSGLGSDRIIRVMPNTPCLVGQGASAFARGSGATTADAQLVAKLLGAVGLAVELDEKLLDAVTGLSGSGPAFVYVMIEALSDGGVRMGLPRTVATQLAAQTVFGAAQMVLGGEHPAVLKDRVASPGGTTIAGLQVLEDRGLRAALIAAVEAATERSKELGK